MITLADRRTSMRRRSSRILASRARQPRCSAPVFTASSRSPHAFASCSSWLTPWVAAGLYCGPRLRKALPCSTSVYMFAYRLPFRDRACPRPAMSLLSASSSLLRKWNPLAGLPDAQRTTLTMNRFFQFGWVRRSVVLRMRRCPIANRFALGAMLLDLRQ